MGMRAVDYSKLAVMCKMVDMVMATEADITCNVHTTLCVRLNWSWDSSGDKRTVGA